MLQSTFQVKILTMLVCGFCLMQCGCLISHSNHQVVRQGEPLRQLTFESESARSAFEATAEHALDHDANESSAAFGIPFLIGLQHSRQTAPNAIRNDVATRLDLNGDQHISEYEASLHR